MTRLVVFLMVLEIFNNESVNSTFKYKLEYKIDYTDYKLEFMTQKFKNLDEIQHTEIFAVVKFWSGKITEFFTIMLIKSKIRHKHFSMICPKKKVCESGFPYCFLTDFTKFFL